MISFETEVCSSAEEAHALLRRRRDFHIVVLDVVMPDINGDDLLPSLRAILGEQVAVVMASAYGQISLVQRCILRGADSFMSKPLRLESISQLWQHCLAKNRRLFSNAPSECDTGSMGGCSMGGCSIDTNSSQQLGGRSCSRGPTPTQSPANSVDSSCTNCSHAALDGGSFGPSPRYMPASPFGSAGARFPPWHPASAVQARQRAQAPCAAAAVAAGGASGWQASARPTQRRSSRDCGSSASAAGGEAAPGSPRPGPGSPRPGPGSPRPNSPLTQSGAAICAAAYGSAGGTAGSGRRTPQGIIGSATPPPTPRSVQRPAPQTEADARKPTGASSAGSFRCSRAARSGTTGPVAFPLGGGAVVGTAARSPRQSPTLQGLPMAPPPPQLLPAARCCLAAATTQPPQPATVRGTVVPLALATAQAAEVVPSQAQAIALAQLQQHQLQQVQQGQWSPNLPMNEGDDEDESGCRQQ